MRREHLFGRYPAFRATTPRMEQTTPEPASPDDAERPPAPAANQAEA